MRVFKPYSLTCANASARARDNMATANKLNASPTSPHLQREARQSGDNLGLSHRNLTSIIVPKSVLKSQVDDLACDGAN